MGPRTIVAAALTAALVVPMAHAAPGQRNHLRVVDARKNVLDYKAVGAARSWADTAGGAHALGPNTAMGQLVAGAAFAGLDVGIEPSSFVTSIDGVPGGATGSWALLIDNAMSPVGAADATLSAGQEVVWLRDPDFASAGPAYLDLDATATARGGLSLLVTRVALDAVGGAVVKPAARVKVRIAQRSSAGLKVRYARTNAVGRLFIAARPGIRIAEVRAIASDAVSECVGTCS